MLTNECHHCANYIEFPEHGVGEHIRCPHCGQSVVLTAAGKTIPGEEHHGPQRSLEAVLQQLEGASASPHPTDRSTGAEGSKSGAGIGHAKSKLLLALGGVAAAVVIAFFMSRQREHKVESSIGRQAALSLLQQDAVNAHAPTGLLGMRWLMSMPDAMKAAPGSKKTAPDKLSENRTFYERPAQVDYYFSSDGLLLISVAFQDSSSAATFDQTQARLAAEYGQMPKALPQDGYVLASTRRRGHFYVRHCLATSGAATVERIYFFVGKGGDPGNFVKPTGGSPKR